MANSPQPNNESSAQNQQSQKLWLLLLSRSVAGFLVVLGAVLAGLGWWLWLYIHDDLAPLIAENLSQVLNRPVELGQVERISFTSIRFGYSKIPAFAKRVDGKVIRDPDSTSAQAVDVTFNPWDLLLTRTLNLDVTLAKPQLYIEQAADGSWIDTQITPRERAGLIKTNLQAIRFRQGQAILVPQGTNPRKLRNVNGNVTFAEQSQQIRFNVAGRIVSGGELALQGQWYRPTQKVTLKTNIKNLPAQFLVGLVPQLPVQIRGGKLDGQIRVDYQPKQPLQLAGQARLDSVDLGVPEQLLLRNGRRTIRNVQNISGTVQFLKSILGARFDLSGQLAAGGKVRVKGEAALPQQQANFLLLAQDVAAPILDGAFQLPLKVQAGQVDANLQIRLRQKQQPDVQGTAQLKSVTARVAALPQPFRNATGLLRFQGLTTTLDGVNALYGKIPLRASGSIDPDAGYALSAQTPPIAIATALDTLKVNRLPFSTTGQVQVPQLQVTGAINEPLVSGVVVNQGIVQIDRVPFEAVSAEFTLDVPNLRVTNIRAVPVVGGLITGRADYALVPGAELVANLQAESVPGNAIAQLYGSAPNFNIGPVAAQIRIAGLPTQLATTVQFQAPAATYPTRGQVRVANGITTLQNIVAQVAGGTLQAQGQIREGLLQATLTTDNLPLRQFSNQLRGLLSGRLNVTAPLANFGLDTVQAQGQVRFSQGLSFIQQPLTAQVRYAGGNQIVVQQATAPGFRAEGTIATRLQGPQAPQITALNLNVQAQDYALSSLPPLGPTAVSLAGLADLQGRLTGTPSNPQLIADLQVNDLALNQFAFESTLAGQLNYSGNQGVNLRLRGDRDRINVALGANLQPESFFIRRDEAIAQGRTEDNRLLVDLQRFPLTALNLSPGAEYSLGRVSGLASGNFDVNLRDRSLIGTIAVERPGIGNISGDRFVGNLRYANGVARLTGGELQQGESQLLVNATLIPGSNPRFSGQIQVAQAQTQDILAALKIFDFADLQNGPPRVYGTAADVQTVSVGLPQAPLLTQLRRLSEIEELVAQQVAQRQATPAALPPLSELQGALQGEITFSGSQQAGLNANFNLSGEDFNWGKYTIDQVVAQGQFANGALNLQPFLIAAGDSRATFSGQIGGQQQSGQLVLDNVPIAQVSQFVNLPFDVTGDLDATATLGGSLKNPTAQGQLQLVDGTLNDTVLEQAQATFNYDNARLAFNSTARIAAPEPILISGSIPYKLPFAAQTPNSQQVRLDVNVKDQGLALLNLFTDQLAWVDGQGAVDLQVRGTLKQPRIRGTVALNNATLNVQALADPLTNVNGTVYFDRDRVLVQRLSGQYSKGQVIAAGVLPLFEEDNLTAAERATPLTVQLDQLAVQLQELYSGEANGTIQVTGTALEPVLGGNIQLENGEVTLAANPNSEATSLPATQETTAAESPFASPQLDNLQVSLADVQVTRSPVLSFLAAGDLTLNGSLNNIRPDGFVRFRQGAVNLFTTRFRLDRRQENYAQFSPGQGLNPYLNLNLVTTVTEVTGGRTTNLNEFADVPASSLGALEPVRVQAKVQGPASQLISNVRNVVELTSTPSRTDSEIFALLGGGFVGQLEQGNASLALANLASAAFLNTVQGYLDNAFGSKVNFRLFPALLPNDSGRSVLELGGELSYDVSRRFSVSLLQLITSPEEPTRITASYQLSDKFQARSSLSLDGEAVGILEYRTRF